MEKIKRKRLFIAIEFPDKTKTDFTNIINSLQDRFPQVSWTKKENIHLTIKFLGYVQDKLLPEIKHRTKISSQGIRPFELVFEKVGFFAREQLIIWLGAKNHSSLLALIKNLDRQMAKLGFKKEKREFTPHITVGRGKRLDVVILKKIKHKIVSTEFILPKPFRVSEITLIESTLTSKGPIYTPINKFALR